MKNLKWLAGITLLCGSMLLTVQGASANSNQSQTLSNTNTNVINKTNTQNTITNNSNNKQTNDTKINNSNSSNLANFKAQQAVNNIKKVLTTQSVNNTKNTQSISTQARHFHRHMRLSYRKPTRVRHIYNYRYNHRKYRHSWHRVNQPKAPKIHFYGKSYAKRNRRHNTKVNKVQTNQNRRNNTNNDNSAKQVQKENFYTYVASPSHWHNGRGFEIFDQPTGNSNHVSYQKYIKHHVVHILKSAVVNHNKWIQFKDMQSKLFGWMKYAGLVTTTRWLKVPLIPQRPQLPTGCEITATTMMLRYHGNHVNKVQLAHRMPRSWNPYRGFVGSPFSYSGWYIWPSGLVPLVNHYTHHHALNMTHWSEPSIIDQINKNRPVVMWVADLDGFPNHALTIIGYTKHDIIFNDPWLDKTWSMNARRLWYLHSLDDLRALSYY